MKKKKKKLFNTFVKLKPSTLNEQGTLFNQVL